MSIICDLEQGGKIDENEAFEQVKALYKQFKHYFKHEHEATSVLDNKKYYDDNKYIYKEDSQKWELVSSQGISTRCIRDT